MRGLFVTGTDTGVGKSILAAAVCAALASRGLRVAAFKPVVTGLDEPAGEWPHDHELLASVASAGQSSDEIAPYRYGPPASPHLAAGLAGEVVDPARLVELARRAAGDADALIVEGVGGAMVPLRGDYLVCDLAAELGLATIVAARPGLGTINHTLLTVEALRRRGLEVPAIVMTPWPAAPSVVEDSNRATVEELAGAPVRGLAPTSPGALAEAGASLSLDDCVR